MTWKTHMSMLMHSAKLVLVSIALIILAAIMFFMMILASAGYGQWQVDVTRQEMAEVIVSE